MGYRIQTSCAEPFWLIAYARKNSKRLLCGLFYGETKANLEVKMLITLQKGQGKGNVKKIKVEGGSDKEKEIIIRHETAHRRKGRSTWNWHEEFALEWSQTFITKKRGRNLK